MSARRIHIVGGPGSGKSFTAARLAEAYGIPATDLDHLFWQQDSARYGVRAPAAERDAALKRILAQPAWITEGVYQNWVQGCFEKADVVLLMETPVWLRQWRILVRFARRGLGLERSKRESLSDLLGLLRWNHSYDGNTLAAVRRTLADLGLQYAGCRNCAEALRAVGRHPADGESGRRVRRGRMLRQAEAGYNERLFGGGLRARFHLARFHWLAAATRRFSPSFRSVLELGCFDGRSIHYLPARPRVYLGFDADWEGGLALAREQWGEVPGYEFHRCELPEQMSLVLGSRACDISLCLETLEHLPAERLDPYLAHIARGTRDLAFITVPNEMGPVFLAKHIVKRVRGEAQPFTPGEILAALIGRMDRVRRHEHKGFDHRAVLRAVERHFEVVRVSGYPAARLPLSLGFGIGIVARPRHSARGPEPEPRPQPQPQPQPEQEPEQGQGRG